MTFDQLLKSQLVASQKLTQGAIDGTLDIDTVKAASAGCNNTARLAAARVAAYDNAGATINIHEKMPN